jgi:dsDNA-specific endonuclease/ATPase MutS2
MQSVSGDLSTFSGHLVVCREMLKKLEQLKQHASSSGNSSTNTTASVNRTHHSLVLLDEIGTG